MQYRKAALVLLILLLLSVSTAHAISYVDLERTYVGEVVTPWLDTWQYRTPIQVNASKIDAALTDYPLLLYLSSSSGETSQDVTSIFDELESNHLKIAVTTSDAITQCYVEVELWDNVTETAWLWVKAPSLSSTSNSEFFIYYDNSQANNTAYVGDILSTPAQEVWDDYFLCVYHLKDYPSAPSTTVADSTGNGLSVTKTYGATEPAEAVADIGYAQAFDGSSDVMRKTNTGFNNSEGLIEVWFQVKAAGQKTMLSTFFNSSYWSSLSRASATGVAEFILTVGGTQEISIFSDAAISTDTPYYVAMAQNGTSRMYLDNVLQVDTDSGEWLDDLYSTQLLDIGWLNSADDYRGDISEIRFSSIDRGEPYIKAAYLSGEDDLQKYNAEQDMDTYKQYSESILVSELEAGYEVKLYNASEALICNATADSDGVANLTLPFAYRLLKFEGSYRIYDDLGSFLYTKWFEDIHGGDEYDIIEPDPLWIQELTLYPNWDLLILLICSLFFTTLFLGMKKVGWGIISFGSWLFMSFVWIFINPLSYPVGLLYLGIAIVILTLTLILQLEAIKMRKKGLGEERITPV